MVMLDLPVFTVSHFSTSVVWQGGVGTGVAAGVRNEVLLLAGIDAVQSR